MPVRWQKAVSGPMTLPDAVEGGMAYLERRQPDWQGSVTRDWPDWMDD